MNKEELDKYYDFFTAVWRFFKKHHSPNTDDEWGAAIEEGDKLARSSPFKSETKHNYDSGTHMTNNGTEIVIKVMEEIERLAQERKHK